MSLKEELKKIYDFVKCEFDIESEEAINEVKERIELEKLDTLNQMIKDYKKALKKAVNAEKRKQAQKEAQKNFKTIQAKYKLEEYEKIENKAKGFNMSLSEYVKSAIEAFKGEKAPEPIQMVKKEDFEALKLDLEISKSHRKKDMELLKTAREQNAILEKEKEEYFKNMTSLKNRNIELEDKLKNIRIDNLNIADLKKEKTILEKELKQAKEAIIQIKTMSIISFIRMKLKR